MIADLVIQLRSLGIRRLEIELDPGVPAPDMQQRDTVQPPDEPIEAKDSHLCIAPGCSEDKGGIFGGSTAPDYCRKHAFEQAGIK